MIKTKYFCYVSGGKIEVPDNYIYVGKRVVKSYPFARPTRIGDMFIGENSDDSELIVLGIYPVYMEEIDISSNSIYNATGYIVKDDYALQIDDYIELTEDEIKERDRNELKYEISLLLEEIKDEILLRNMGLDGVMDDSEFNSVKGKIQDIHVKIRNLL